MVGWRPRAVPKHLATAPPRPEGSEQIRVRYGARGFRRDAGLSEQQIVDLIIHHRAHHGRPQAKRLDYFRRTIAKAFASVDEGARPARRLVPSHRRRRRETAPPPVTPEPERRPQHRNRSAKAILVPADLAATRR